MNKQHADLDMFDKQTTTGKYLTMADVKRWFKQQSREKQERIIKLLEEES